MLSSSSRDLLICSRTSGQRQGTCARCYVYRPSYIDASAVAWTDRFITFHILHWPRLTFSPSNPTYELIYPFMNETIVDLGFRMGNNKIMVDFGVRDGASWRFLASPTGDRCHPEGFQIKQIVRTIISLRNWGYRARTLS